MAPRSPTRRGCAAIPTAGSTCASTTARSVSEGPWVSLTNSSLRRIRGGHLAAVSPSAASHVILPDDSRMTVHVVTAAQSAARDRAAIDGGIPSRALMQRAGAAAAAEIAREFGDRLTRGAAIFAGPGNNGGDAWVVALSLIHISE